MIGADCLTPWYQTGGGIDKLPLSLTENVGMEILFSFLADELNSWNEFQNYLNHRERFLQQIVDALSEREFSLSLERAGLDVSWQLNLRTRLLTYLDVIASSSSTQEKPTDELHSKLVELSENLKASGMRRSMTL